MIPLAVPNVGEREERYLRRCIETGFVSSVGEFVERFEQAVAEAAGAPYGTATSSGTTGLHLALTLCGVEHGDLVVLPSFTFIASANAVRQCGADPWLFDVEPESWTLDPETVEAALQRHCVRDGGGLRHEPTGRRVAALMPVYTLGHPARMDRFREIGERFGLPVIADAAAALGARFRDRELGSLADLTVFSFNGNKTVTAGGGGVLVGEEESLIARGRHLATTARVGAEYHHDVAGFNYRLTNLQAAVGLAQVERLEELVGRKRAIDARYREALEGTEGLRGFPQADWAWSACWFSGVLLPEDAPPLRDVCSGLVERGIGARTFWKPIHLQPPYAESPREVLPVTESFWRRVLTLPCSTHLSAEDQERAISAVREVLGGRGGRPA